MKVYHLASEGSGESVFAQPVGKACAAKAGERRPVVDSHHAFDQLSGWNDVEGEVCQGCERLGQLANRSRPGQDVIAQPPDQAHFALLNQCKTRSGVHLGNLYACWAGQVAGPAAAAVIHRGIRNGLVWLAETPRLRASIFGTGKEISDGGNRANRGADVAFDTLVEGQFDRVVVRFYHGVVEEGP